MMKKRVIAVSLTIGLCVGVLSGIGYASNGGKDTMFTKSPLPGGGLKAPHNQRLHLSTNERWIYDEGHLSDLIRLQWTEERAKPSIAWVNEKGLDKTAIVSHAKANDTKQADHNHISIETSMSPTGKYPNQLFTRLEIPFDQDVAEIRTHSSNFNVVDGILRIAGSEGVNRDLQFAQTVRGNEISPRWSVRADTNAESGSNAGSNFQIIRYSDSGEAIDAPIFIDRLSGNVGIGNTDASSKLDVNGDRIRIREAMTPASSTAKGSVGDMAWDDGYIYICVAENTWKRAALESW